MRQKYLDVLKAIAIIAVVLYHSGYSTYGYLGVDLFLVIAGYLTTRGLCSKILLSNDWTGGRFYVKFELSRINRLLPPLLIVGSFCMLLGYLVMLPDDYENLSQSVIATNFFGNNVLAAITTKNYWAVANEYKPLMHTWYAGVIMHFYLFYPVLFYLAKLNKKHPQRTLSVLVGLTGVFSLLLFFITTDVAQRFYYLPSRFFEFAAGGMIALSLSSQRNTKYHISKWVVYFCYTLLLALFFVNVEILPSNIKLVLVVVISCVLVLSKNILENSITGNQYLAKIGEASYSIFLWHQVLLAYYRYTISSHFTFVSYGVFIIAVALLSWLTYGLIEQKISGWLKHKESKLIFYTIVIAVFLALNSSCAYIYLHAGVVRDVPELYIDKKDIHRGLHSEYNDKIYQLDKPFETEKEHWLIIGNSFGRDFTNVILESPIADKVEVSYIFEGKHVDPVYSDRYATADKVFFSTKGVTKDKVSEVETLCVANGLSPDQLVVVGEKNFGENNGQFYINRNKPYYFEQRTKVNEKILENNIYMKSLYGNRYLDLLSLVIDKENTVPVFSPDHHYISQDCYHFSKGGAVWFAQLIDWSKFIH
jgi:peptidoglycan/LPS O-acetylase OafA/YrhL